MDGTSAVLYDNGNQVGTADITSPNINSCSAAALGANFPADDLFFNGTVYRARFWNKVVDAKALFERADVPVVDQYGRQAVRDGSAISSSNWSNGTGWTFSPSNKATYTTGSGAGALSQTGVFTSADSGKNVRITFTVENVSSGSPSHSLFIGNAAGGVAYKNYTNYGAGTHTAEFTMPSGQTTLGFWSNGATFTISNISVHVEGCVSDYDLAFANENQSRMVADRSTNNVDGEMSSSGVKQTQVIKQLNSTAMRVGGTSATAVTPADGEIIAGGVTAKTSTTGGITIDASGQTDTTARFELKADRPSADQDACDIRFYNNNAAPIAHISAVKGSGSNDTDGNQIFTQRTRSGSP